MIKKILVCGLLLLFTNTANANVITYGAKKTIQISGIAIVGTAFVSGITLNIILKSIESGKNFEKPIKILNKASNVKTTALVYQALFSYLILKYEYGSRPDIAQSAMTIISSSDLYTREYEQQFESDRAKLEGYVAEFGKISQELDKKFECEGKDKIYKNGLEYGPQKGGDSVKEWDYGSYKFLSSIEEKDDHLEHDHIPALKSIFTYLETRDRLPYNLKRIELKIKNDKKTEKSDAYILGNKVKNNTSAVELHEDTHAKGRTFRGRVNKIIENPVTKSIERLHIVDASNLKLATVLDFAFYAFDEGRISPHLKEAFYATYERNKKLCLYEGI